MNKYRMVYDMGHTIDGIDYDDFQAACDNAIETMCNWKAEEMSGWDIDSNGIPHPTEKQIESWDTMINECCCYVAKWNEEVQDFYDEKMNYWYPSDEDVEWLYWEEMKKKYNW